MKNDKKTCFPAVILYFTKISWSKIFSTTDSDIVVDGAANNKEADQFINFYNRVCLCFYQIN